MPMLLCISRCFISPACWRTARDVMRNFNKLKSETAQREVMKEQIRIRVIGLGWKDLRHAWSKNGIVYLVVVLRDYLIKTILAEEKKRSIPETPPIVLPLRVDRGKLGTMSADYDLLKKHDEDKKRLVMEGGLRMREWSEDNGAEDWHERMQPPRPNIDGSLIDRRMEQRWDFKEPSGKVVPMWCKGTIVAVKGNSRVHIRWDDNYVREGETNVTEERLLVSKWNKQVEEGWRFVISED